MYLTFSFLEVSVHRWGGARPSKHFSLFLGFPGLTEIVHRSSGEVLALLMVSLALE